MGDAALLLGASKPRYTSKKNSPLLSLTTVAVSPAALDPLPEVYTDMGACGGVTLDVVMPY